MACTVGGPQQEPKRNSTPTQHTGSGPCKDQAAHVVRVRALGDEVHGEALAVRFDAVGILPVRDGHAVQRAVLGAGRRARADGGAGSGASPPQHRSKYKLPILNEGRFFVR